MTEQRFEVCRHLLDTRPWDFFMLVEIGLDRMHHAFWRFLDPAHPRHEPGHRYRDAIRNYYVYLDERDRRAAGALRRRHDGPGRLRPRRAPDAGRDLRQRVARRRRATSCSSSGRRPDGLTPFSEDRRSTGAGRARGARAATTAGCASTSPAASRRGSSTPGEFEPLRDELADGSAAARSRRRADRHARLPSRGALARAARGSRRT